MSYSNSDAYSRACWDPVYTYGVDANGKIYIGEEADAARKPLQAVWANKECIYTNGEFLLATWANKVETISEEDVAKAKDLIVRLKEDAIFMYEMSVKTGFDMSDIERDHSGTRVWDRAMTPEIYALIKDIPKSKWVKNCKVAPYTYNHGICDLVVNYGTKKVHLTVVLTKNNKLEILAGRFDNLMPTADTSSYAKMESIYV